MRKLKKLFHYEKPTIEAKELEEDLKSAEELIEKLKKVDPIDERRRNRQDFFSRLAVCFLAILFFIVFIFGFYSGYDTALKLAESIYNYSVATGIFIPEE